MRSIEQNRGSSPERKLGASALPLSDEARKISHSRSSTEPSAIPRPEGSACISPDSSDREEERMTPRVRKKSGELVRPALRPPSRRRPSSMPGTPTYSKAVHFDSQLEHIRHFLRLDKPLAVSADTSPANEHSTETEYPFPSEGPSFGWELRLPNFPKDQSARAHQPVRLERVYLSSDRSTLVGVVAVANLAFQKLVVARFTFDYWKTVSEVGADYSADVRRKQAHDGYDRFTFGIKLSDQTNLEKKTMFICIRYSVNGQEFWDNNNYTNYQVDFIKTPRSDSKEEGSTIRPAASLPRSRSSTNIHDIRHRSLPASFDDFSELDQYKYLSFDPLPKPAKKESLPKQDTSEDLVSDAPKRRDPQTRQAFGNRYDFGASLSAAMRTKPTEDRTTLTAKAKSESKSKSESWKQEKEKKKQGLFIDTALPTTDVNRQEARPEKPQPSALVSGKPHLDSSVYKELVDKYCFYASKGSAAAKHGASTVNEASASHTDSTKEVPFPSTLTRTSSSPDQSLHTDSSSNARPQLPHAASMSSVGLGSHPSSSPVAFGYPYQSAQRRFLTESQTPAVIKG